MATNIGTGPQDIPLNQFLGEMAFQDKATTVVAGSRVTNPNTTSVEWLYLPPNIQVIHLGEAESYTSNFTNSSERVTVQVQTASGWKNSGYRNYSWNCPGGGTPAQGFNTDIGGINPYYWTNNSARETINYTLTRLGTTNTFNFSLQGSAYNGSAPYLVWADGYFDAGAEITGIRFTTYNGNANLNGSFFMNYMTR